MTTKLTRRTALLGSVTLPAALAPLGMANSASPSSAEPDPAVTAMWEWHRRRLMEREVLDMFNDLEKNLPRGAPEVEDFQETVVSGMHDYVNEAAEVCAATVPATPAGLVATLTVAACTNDALSGARDGHREDCIVVAALIAAERIAGISYLPEVALYAPEKLPDDPGVILRARLERRREYEEQLARLVEVAKSDSTVKAFKRSRYSDSYESEFLVAAQIEGWSLDYVLTGEGSAMRGIA